MSSSSAIKNNLRLAICQFNPIWERPTVNLQKLDNILDSLSVDVDVFILPEAFATGFSMDAEHCSQSMTGEIVTWMQQKAIEKQLVICGSVFISEAGKNYNRFLWIQPDKTVHTYNKRHLFSIGNENKNYSQGDTQCLINYFGWKIFPQICYDLRFPVWSRNTMEYHILLNVANWPAPRHKVWKTLLSARAIENQCYVIGVNRTGHDGNGISYRGDSLVIDAKGNTLIDAKENEDIHIITLNKDSLISFRDKFNTLKDSDSFEII